MSTKVASSAPKAIRRLQINNESDLPKDACQTPGKTDSFPDITEHHGPMGNGLSLSSPGRFNLGLQRMSVNF